MRELIHKSPGLLALLAAREKMKSMTEDQRKLNLDSK